MTVPLPTDIATNAAPSQVPTPTPAPAPAPNTAPTAAAPSPPPVAAPATVEVPVGWLLDHGAAPIQYRTGVEIARLSLGDLPGFETLPYGYPPAVALALAQRADGTWGAGASPGVAGGYGGTMLTVPSARAEHFQGVGTVSAVRRLLEYGWDRESPPLIHARRVLFRLLAEDTDPTYLFELAMRGAPDGAAAHGRALLREASAATLAAAGYQNDPRLRGAARRLLDRLDAFLRSPTAAKPFVRSGNQHVLAPDAAPPSAYTLLLLASMPLFRSENYDVMERLYAYLSQPQPRATPAVVIGKRAVPQPQLILGDPLPSRNVADAEVPTALFWLELFARLGFLRLNEGWSKLYDRLLDERDADGVWRVQKRVSALRTTNPAVWPSFPLEPDLTGERRWADVTFRLALIARAAERPLIIV